MDYTLNNLNNIITLVRGDYLEITPFINIGTNLCPSFIDFRSDEYNGYKIFFGLMEPNQAFENSILYKNYVIDDSFLEDSTNLTDDGSLIIKLYSEDTLCLHPGRYNYSIKLQRPTTCQISTIINNSDFYIL